MGSAAKHALREASLWTGVVLAGIALVYFYDDLAATVRRAPEAIQSGASQQKQVSAAGFDREVRLRANAGGHFVVEASIDGRPVTLMADTGATLIVLSFEDAERLGLRPRSLDFSARARTANGVAAIALVTLDRVEVGDVTVRDVAAAVAERGALGNNLLGMSFLGRLTRFEMRGQELVLVQ